MATRRTKSKPPPSTRAAEGRGFSKLVLENVRCFVKAEVPLDAQVTVIIGQNGAGKTTIAEAIASLVDGKGEGLDAFPLRRAAPAGVVELYGDASEPVARWRSGLKDRHRLPHDRRVFVYGQYRALRPPRRRVQAGPELLPPGWQDARPLPDDLADALSRPVTRTLFDFDEYVFRDLAAYVALLADRGAYEPAARRVWERLREWLQSADGPHLDEVELTELEGRRVAALCRSGITLAITDLSDGYRAVLAVVLDLAIRYTQIFPGLADPLEGEATVVIDEVDLNLHPRWQRQVIKQLTSLFPGTRFVLTTHSAAVVQAAIDEKHAVLVLDEKPGAGTTVRRLKSAKLRGAEVDSVLVEVFGVDSRYSPTYEKLETEAAALRAKVEEGEATEAERRRLLDVLDELTGLLAREEEREGTGPLMSEIARSQVAFLRSLEAAMPKKGGRRGQAPAKRR